MLLGGGGDTVNDTSSLTNLTAKSTRLACIEFVWHFERLSFYVNQRWQNLQPLTGALNHTVITEKAAATVFVHISTDRRSLCLFYCSIQVVFSRPGRASW